MAEIVTAFPDVQIAMADAGRLHPDQHLRSQWLRRRLLHLSQGRVEIGHLETFHRFTPGIFALRRTLPRPCRRDKRVERLAVNAVPPAARCPKKPLFAPRSSRS